MHLPLSCSQLLAMRNVVDRLRHLGEVVRVETGDGNAAIRRHIEVVLLSHLGDHVGRAASVGEHANLVGNVAPVVRAAG